MLASLVLGISALPALKRETFPDFAPSQVQVSVVYPGASAEDVEEAICLRVEDAIDGISHVKEVVAEAREGLGRITVEMSDDGDVATFLTDIKAEVEAINDFPTLVEDPVIEQIGRKDQVVSLAVSGNVPATELESYCDLLKLRLQRLPEVSLVEVTGFSDRQIRIEIAADDLQRYALSATDIASTIERQNVDLPAGAIQGDEGDFLVRFTEQRRTVGDYADLVVVAGSTGAEIRLGDIAQITERFELDEAKLMFDGQRAGLLKIEKTKAEDSLVVVDAVQRFVDEQRAIQPPGIELALTQDVSSIARDRLQMLVKNGWQGLLLVFATMWLFFNARLAFWVAAGLPVAFFGAFFLMPPMGQSINMLTMVGLLLALGLLMDDAIVIAENVATQLRRHDGENGARASLHAAVNGTRQVARGVLSSFATTVCVFLPLSFLSGDIGKVLEVLPIVLILVLTISLIEAFLIMPHHLASSLRDHDPEREAPLRRRFNAFIEWLRDRVVGRAADFCVDHRYAACGVVLGILVATIGLTRSGTPKFEAFPDLDGDVIQARLLLPQGTPLNRTEAIANVITNALRRVDAEFTPAQPDGQQLVQSYSVQFNTNADAKEEGAHVATVSADLLNAEVRQATIDEIKAAWRQEVGSIPDVLSLTFKEPALGPAGLPFEIRLRGDALERLQKASLVLRQWLAGLVGVFDISDDLRPGKPELRVRLRDGALALGVDARLVSDQLRTAFYGRTASEIQVGNQSYEVDVRLLPSDRETVADLDFFQITLPDGTQTPLSTLADVEYDRGWARIARVDGIRALTVQADIDTREANSAELIALFRSELLPDLEADYPDISFEILGSTKEASTTQVSMLRGLLFGLIGVFMLLSLQFKSYLEPIVVLLAIPMCLIGVIWGHVVMGLPLTLPSILGFCSLAGVVVNDSILLIEFIKIRRAEGMSSHDAGHYASRDRFRAVLLTSVTTIAGLAPLMFEKSLQAQILVPIAVSIVFGLLASTVLILLLVPALYNILDDFGLVRSVPAPGRAARE